ncbi:hypothetical protein SDC9_70826 [bioreactor metagenome]|uniref:Uncharacterized protein n=1 Tax=bioreactor metagenome TaxID=1076179 RepID=A0A644YDW6_9ZZZZ
MPTITPIPHPFVLFLISATIQQEPSMMVATVIPTTTTLYAVSELNLRAQAES